MDGPHSFGDYFNGRKESAGSLVLDVQYERLTSEGRVNHFQIFDAGYSSLRRQG
jgi:hypothetical protein